MISAPRTILHCSLRALRVMYTKRLEPQKTHSIHMLFFTQIQEISIYYKYRIQFEKLGDYHDYINE